MSKPKKRTISSLMKTRSEGRFSRGGFDLLGDGDRLRASARGDVLEIDLTEKTTPLLSSPKKDSGEKTADAENARAKRATAKSASAKNDKEVAVGSSADVKTAYADSVVVKNTAAESVAEENARAKAADVKNAIAKFTSERDAVAASVAAKAAQAISAVEKLANAKNAKAKSAAAKSASAKKSEARDAKSGVGDSDFGSKKSQKTKSAITSSKKKAPIARSSGSRKGVLANRDAFHMAVEEIECLKAERESATLVENYIFDTLFAKINNPSASIVYLYLWRRTAGKEIKSIGLSMRVLSDAIGISKRTAHEAIKKLNELGLVESTKESMTGIPEHTLKMPWKNE